MPRVGDENIPKRLGIQPDHAGVAAAMTADPLVTPQVIFGGKNPHPHYCAGGMPCSISLEDGNAPVNTARLGIVDRAINLGRTLVNNYYIPDVLAIGAAYVKAGRVDGGGLAKERVLGYGSYPIEPFSGTCLLYTSPRPRD